ncbi:MAG: hypothetical protein WC938_03795 [Candidatus Paceibacterota bacterium]|jgi:hypothetical protein
MSKIICQNCKEEIKPHIWEDGVVDYDDVYEYRGFNFHEKCFDEGIKKVDQKRNQVMETVSKSIESQRNGEFINNRNKYHTGNVASDGLQ